MPRLLARPPKTVEDFMKLPEGTRAELIGGEFIMSPSPKVFHQTVVLRIVRALCAFVEARRLGQIFIAPLDVHLPSGDVVEPDVIFVARASEGILQDWIRGVPELLVEVLSPDGITRDRIVKRDLYAANGVKEYWIVDLEAKTVEVFVHVAGAYDPRGYFQGSDVLVAPLLPGFSLPLADLFA